MWSVDGAEMYVCICAVSHFLNIQRMGTLQFVLSFSPLCFPSAETDPVACSEDLCGGASDCHKSSQFTHFVAFQVTWVVLSLFPHFFLSAHETGKLSRRPLAAGEGEVAWNGSWEQVVAGGRFIQLVGLSLAVNCIPVLGKPGPWGTERADS